MVSNTYAHGLVDIVGGVCGSLCVIKACALFEQYVPSCIVMLFAKYGAITLPVFCMHLVELNVFPWESIVEIVSAALPLPIWIPILLLRFMLVAVMTLVLWAMPRAISGIYFRSRKRREV